MKPTKIYRFKFFIKKLVSIFASREFAFLYAILGSLSLIAHSYFLIYSVSSFTGAFKVIQAIGLSTFISTSLLYFVAIADSDDSEKEYKRIIRAVNLFMYMEILMNLYYYCKHLIIDAPQMRLFDFLFGTIISILIPVTIKLYANSIKAKQWLKELEEQENSNEDINENNEKCIDTDFINNSINEIVTKEIENIKIENQKCINECINDNLHTISTDLNANILNTILQNDQLFSEEINSKIDAKIGDKKFERIDIDDIDKFYHQKINSKIDDTIKKYLDELSINVRNDINQKFDNVINEKIENSVKTMTKKSNIR